MTYTLPYGPSPAWTLINGAPVQGFLHQGLLRPVADLDGTGAVVSPFMYGMGVNEPEYFVRGATTSRQPLIYDPLAGLVPFGARDYDAGAGRRRRSHASRK